MKPIDEGGLGFAPANISSIVGRGGNNVDKAVEALSASKDRIVELMKPIEDGGLGFTINQIKIKLFGVKSSLDLNEAEIEAFESEELLHQPSSEVSQAGKRRRSPSGSSIDLNEAEIEAFESEELLHQPSSEVSQAGKRRRSPSGSSIEPQARGGRQRL